MRDTRDRQDRLLLQIEEREIEIGKRRKQIEDNALRLRDGRSVYVDGDRYRDEQGRVDSAAQFVCEDVVEQVPLPGQGPGLEGLKDILRQMRAAFPDLDFSIKEQIAEGEKVASRFEWTGTHQQQFLGVPATGRPVRVWGVVIDRPEGGRIKDTRIIMDTLGLMMQLGVFPLPGA